MHRVPEQELMAPRQADAYAAADLSELHQPLVAAFAARFGEVRGRMLDLGCGTADMAIRLAAMYPHLTVLGIDGAEAMLAHGVSAVRRAGLADRVRLVHRHLGDVDDDPSFDVVVANSVLHHLPEPGMLWSAVRRAARRGAAVMVSDLHRPAGIADAERLVATHGAEAHPVLQKDFFNSLCAAYTAGEVRLQLREAGLDAFDVERIGELHVIAWGRAA